MTLTTSSRKRDRTAAPEDTDYIPVTKRMNSLHIDVMSDGANNLNDALIGQQINGLEMESNHHQMDPFAHQLRQHHQQCVEHTMAHMNGHHNHHNHSVVIDNSHHHSQCLAVYSPELDSNSNPIYYESNRILFEAHIQRLHRMSIGCTGGGGHHRKS
ncbi:unnamed protein product [Medioppia subpectinata]|uniref:Uncharacterized protein n=1 Tax=Medioppia subpectinata TaxID=1979941 RepID=A0A7R9KHY0_9ACAR|nr:unnamed protein product [Medioppia subpectinata]CAG2103565.1 unnamed protein product [Medioppia subpectinata]